jgi:hypothetical protein
MSEWSFADDYDTDAPTPATPTPPVPAPAAPAAAPVPAPPLALDPVAAALEQIRAIREDASHPLNPLNHRSDPAKRQAWDSLYQRAYGSSSDPAHVAPAGDDVGGWGPATEAVAELREICSREGGLPPFGSRAMTITEFDTLVESCCLATGDSEEAKRLVSEISVALWGSNSLDRRAEQDRLREQWGAAFEANVATASRVVASIFPDHPAEAGRFVAQHPRLMRLAVQWAEQQARRARR